MFLEFLVSISALLIHFGRKQRCLLMQQGILGLDAGFHLLAIGMDEFDQRRLQHRDLLRQCGQGLQSGLLIRRDLRADKIPEGADHEYKEQHHGIFAANADTLIADPHFHLAVAVPYLGHGSRLHPLGKDPTMLSALLISLVLLCLHVIPTWAFDLQRVKPNLHPNPTIPSASGWVGSGAAFNGSVTRTAGTGSISITQDQLAFGPAIPITPGKTYTCGVYFMGTHSPTDLMRLTLALTDSAGSSLGIPLAPVTGCM